jgi:hypothetical protein
MVVNKGLFDANTVLFHEMGRACRTNGGEAVCIWDIGGKARRKEVTRKIKTYVGGQY